MYDIHNEKGWGGLENCHMLTESIVFKQTDLWLIFMEGWWLGGWGMIFGHHNCMIPNIKSYFD